MYPSNSKRYFARLVLSGGLLVLLTLTPAIGQTIEGPTATEGWAMPAPETIPGGHVASAERPAIEKPTPPVAAASAHSSIGAETGGEPQPLDQQPLPGQQTQQDAQREAKPEATTERKLIVSSWSGAYGDAQARAVIAPLTRNLGFMIERRAHQAGSANVAGVDVAELDQQDLLAACRSGKILKLPAFDGVTNDDFFANPGENCGVPTFAWSSMIVADGDAMQKLAGRRYRAPSELSDVLDVRRYPGKRALIRSPRRLLEMMLLASGTSRGDVYDRLRTRQGRDDAFKILDELSEDILWVSDPREALLALDDGRATMAMTYSGRAFRRLISGRLLPIWDGHIIDYAAWTVPAGSRNPEKAERFILAATRAESLAAQARLWPYGPMRRSALPLAQRHALLDTELAPFMPTSDMRFGQGLLLDAAFWSEFDDDLQRRFDDWLAGVPLGIRVTLPVKAPPPPLPPVPARLGG